MVENFRSLIFLLSLCFSGVESSTEKSCSLQPDGECGTSMLPPAPSPYQTQQHEPLVSSNLSSCVDKDKDDCQMKAVVGRCARDPETLFDCPLSCSLCNNLKNSTVRTFYGEPQDANEPETVDHIVNMQNYMLHTVFADDYEHKSIRSSCRNRHKECSYWAATGECENNPQFLKVNCAPACFSCEMLDHKVRCPFDEEAAKESTVWKNVGDLDRFFQDLAQNNQYREKYNLTVLSGPAQDAADSSAGDNPWIIQLDNFLSPLECSRLIDLGHEMGFQRSKDIGKKRFDGTYESYTSSQRTSSTAWCSLDTPCVRDPMTKAITTRIEKLVGIPSNYSEHLQFLRYEVGQRYATHHDFGNHMIGRPAGVRILTVFLYLNDDGLRGGGTNFPDIPSNITVQPKQGRAVLWPSVLNSEPGAKDPRTMHQALPVEAGVKYGANAWFHERDFRTPQLSGCNQ